MVRKLRIPPGSDASFISYRHDDDAGEVNQFPPSFSFIIGTMLTARIVAEVKIKCTH